MIDVYSSVGIYMLALYKEEQHGPVVKVDSTHAVSPGLISSPDRDKKTKW